MEAGHAAKAALNEIVDGTLFAVVSGNGTAQIVYPYAHQGALAVMSSHTRTEAHRAVEGLRAQGGTAMGTLAHARPADLRDRPARDEEARDPAHRWRQRG